MEALFGRYRTTALVLGIFACAGLAACSHGTVRAFSQPERLDNFCLHGAVGVPSVMSVVSSLSDTSDSVLTLRTAQVRAQVKKSGGAIGYWRDLNVLLPNLARQAGDAQGYVHLRAVAIGEAPADAQVRNVQALVANGGRERWYQFQAYDVQSVCIVGNVKM